MENKRGLLPEEKEELFRVLRERFDKNMNRHRDIHWAWVEERIISKSTPQNLQSLYKMEQTGGEPDVLDRDIKTGEYIFYDCSKESPYGRRGLCYDYQGLESRKEHKPKGNAVDTAAAIGVEILTEEQYKHLQKSGNYDTKTSSWVKTPSDIRELGGVLFCDRRYDHVFLYHNGAQSYYAARGFRGLLRV